MPKIKITVLEGDLTIEEVAKLVHALGGDGPLVLPAGATGQQATLRKPEPVPLPDVPLAPVVVPPAPVVVVRAPEPDPVPTPSEVIQQTMALDVEPMAAPTPEPKGTPAPIPQPTVESNSALAGCRKLRDVLEALRGQGFTTPEQLVGECQRLRADVPILARIAADQIDERVRRTLEGMA